MDKHSVMVHINIDAFNKAIQEQLMPADITTKLGKQQALELEQIKQNLQDAKSNFTPKAASSTSHKPKSGRS